MSHDKKRRTFVSGLAGVVALSVIALILPLSGIAAAAPPASQYIDCTPDALTAGAPGTVTMTCTARDSGPGGALEPGADIDFYVAGTNSLPAQHGCTTAANGQCSFSYPVTSAAGAALDVLWVSTNQDGPHTNVDGCVGVGFGSFLGTCDFSLFNLQSRVPTFLNVATQTETVPTGTARNLTVTVRDQFGQRVSGAPVDFEIITGPNAGGPGFVADFSCATVTDAAGQCTGSYTGNSVGNDTVCAWADDGDNLYVPGGLVADGGECSLLEAVTETDVAGLDPNGVTIPGTPGNDLTDAVTRIWQTRVATFLNVDPEAGAPQVPHGSHSLTATARDQFGDPMQGLPVDFEILSGPNSNGPVGADFTCSSLTNAAGQCTGSYSTVPGFVTGTDTICGWIDDSDNLFVPGGIPDDGGQCATEDIGQTEIGVNPDAVALPGVGNDFTDVVTKQWITGGGSSVVPPTAVNAEPESDTAANGSQRQVTVTITGPGGVGIQGIVPNSMTLANPSSRLGTDVANPAAGTSPNFEGNALNFNVYSCTMSNAQGVSTCTFQDPAATGAGTDTTVFYVNTAVNPGSSPAPDAGDPQDAVQKTWTVGTPTTPPTNPPPPPTNPPPPPTNPPTASGASHARTLSMWFNQKPATNQIVVFGWLKLDGSSEKACLSKQPLEIQRRVRGVWVTKATPETSGGGRYAVTLFKRLGVYRVVALETTLPNGDLCLRAEKQSEAR